MLKIPRWLDNRPTDSCEVVSLTCPPVVASVDSGHIHRLLCESSDVIPCVGNLTEQSLSL
jgi:hypothetical protein